MTDFLTLEDINSVLLEYRHAPFWDSVEINTDENNSDFMEVKFNYCEVMREQTNDGYVFSINVFNSLWLGKCYFHNGNGEYISNVTYSDDLIVVSTDTPNITGYFHLNSTGEFSFNNVSWKVTDSIVSKTPIITVTSVNPDFNPEGENFSVSDILTICENNQLIITGDSTGGFIPVSYDGLEYMVFYKTPECRPLLVRDGMSNLGIGVSNVLSFKLSNTNGVLTSNDVRIVCDYPVSDVNIINANYLSFKLDLSQKYDLSPVKLTIRSNVFCEDAVFNLDCGYPVIITGDDFVVGIGNNINADLTLTHNILVDKDTLVIGDGYTLDCDGFGFHVTDGAKLIIENLRIIDGNTTILQDEQTSVTLTDCTFENCSTSDYLGSVVHCNIDVESLNEASDFITNINHCTFNEITGTPIYHGGQLTVTQSELTSTQLNTDDIPYFLYMTDGEANITNNTFNLTDNETIPNDIGLSSCLIVLGENSIINDKEANLLQEKDSLPLFDNPYFNNSTLNIKYYYTEIESNIQLTPTKEEKNCCHSIIGVDYIFKNNTTLTRSE